MQLSDEARLTRTRFSPGGIRRRSVFAGGLAAAPPREALWRSGWRLIRASIASWSDHRAPSMGAAIAYYATFSIAPLLFIAISIAGLVFGPDAVQGAVFEQLADLMGDNGARAIQELVARVSRPESGAVATATSAVILLLGASSVFAELQSALNAIWDVSGADGRGGLWKLMRTRLLSFGMVLGLGFLIVVSLLLSAIVASLGKWWGGWFGAAELIAYLVDFVVNLALLTLAFAMIYKVAPRTRIEWMDVWVGAAGTALLFTIGKVLIGLYLGKSSIASSFGVFASLAIVMVWVYYSAQIFLLGAEFTHEYAKAHGSRRGKKNAAVDPPAAARS